MPINQYGLNTTDENNPLGTTSTQTPVTGINQSAQQAQANPFGSVASNQINALGAAPVAPPVQNFNFNAKYAGQNQQLEQLLADKGMERQNQLFAAQQSYDKNVADAGRTRDKALEQLINKYASSGLIGSGIDARSRGDLETNYNQYLGDLSLALGNTKQGVEGNWANTLRDVNNQRTQMWSQQGEDDRLEQIRVAKEQSDAAKAQSDADNARAIAESYAAAQRDAAARPPAVINMGSPYANAIGGGGGGGYGGGGGGGGGGGDSLGITGMEPAGINAGNTMADLQGQINLLFNTGGVSQLALMYSHPYFQTPNMQPMKEAIRGMISQMSTVGNPHYTPQPAAPPGTFFY